MSRNIKFAIGEYYHIYNRGTDKRIVFEFEQDYLRFIHLLYLCNDSKSLSIKRNLNPDDSFEDLMLEENEPLVSIGAFCLMPNHFHFLVKEIIENGISKFMHKLSTAYTMYFNLKNERTGVLFQGRFKAEHLDSDRYLKYIFSYIHLNPIKIIDKEWKENGLKDKIASDKFLRSYKFSSYLDYLEEYRLFGKVINKDKFPEYFPTTEMFENCTKEWLHFKEIGG
jgi:putative transposase